MHLLRTNICLKEEDKDYIVCVAYSIHLSDYYPMDVSQNEQLRVLCVNQGSETDHRTF